MKIRIIVFSGIDGAGKSTQIEKVKERIYKLGEKPHYLWTRGGYTGPFNKFKKILRKILGKKYIPSGRTKGRKQAFSKSWIRNSWLILAIIDLMFVYGIYIRYLNFIGCVVILDRYLWDTWIDFKINFPQTDFDKWVLWKILKFLAPKPDKTFLLLIPVKESIKRSKLKNEPFPDYKDVLEMRLGYYKKIRSSFNWKLIDCTQTIENIYHEISSEIFTREN